MVCGRNVSDGRRKDRTTRKIISDRKGKAMIMTREAVGILADRS